MKYLLLTLLSSCGFQLNPTHQYTYTIDAGFTVVQQEAIRAALTDWEFATEGTITFKEATPTNHNYQIKINVGDPGEGRGGKANAFFGNITMRSDEPQYKFNKIIRHEIGHIVGLNHSDPNTIMCSDTGCQSSNITCPDVEQFCSVWSCNAKQFYICLQ